MSAGEVGDSALVAGVEDAAGAACGAVEAAEGAGDWSEAPATAAVEASPTPATTAPLPAAAATAAIAACLLASFSALALARCAAFLGSCHVVFRSRWSTKYVLPFGAVRASHPSGRGPSGSAAAAVRAEVESGSCESGSSRTSDEGVGVARSVPSASSTALTAAAPRRCSASVMRR